jgi:hypothetical protein
MPSPAAEFFPVSEGKRDLEDSRNEKAKNKKKRQGKIRS